MALYIFSDAHLGSGTADQEAHKRRKIAELFDMIKADGDRLIILGDLFDYWFEYKHAIPKEHHEVLFMISDLIKHGVSIDYVSGNHDFWLGDFFAREMKVTIHRDQLDLNYGGRQLHLIHGDGLAQADRGYRLLKRILRNPVCIWLYRLLPADWATALAKRVSGGSRRYTGSRTHGFAPDYDAYAESKLANGFDFVAIGHLHTPIMKTFGPGVYVNTGDFIEHFSYAKLADGNMTLRFLD